jgi:deoxyribodipyrimidine photo-lyase
MTTKFAAGLVWFRRDLRLTDNAALSLALQNCRQVHCVFIFDRTILDPLPRSDRRVEFIHKSLLELDTSLRQFSHGGQGGLIVLHAVAQTEIVLLAEQLHVQAVFAAHDYEPLAIARDQHVRENLALLGITLQTCKDHVIFEKREILTQAGTPFGVFTPYKNAWLARLTPAHCQTHPTDLCQARLAAKPAAFRHAIPTLNEIGFASSNLSTLNLPTGMSGAAKLFENFFQRMDQYHETRNFPSLKGPSYLGIHLRFGTLSIRQLVACAWQRQIAGCPGAAVWLSELIWRDFYFSILSNYPHVTNHAFKPAYDAIEWEQGVHAQSLFHAWCNAATGYPLVDAAMLQLNQTGYMHNRLRMVAGSFLVKDLGLNWRWGEHYFAQHLNDFELASNNGGWQWVSSSGCDAQPYFRIFNPITQSENFDPQGKFIRRYLPQLTNLTNQSIHAPWLTKPLELQQAGILLGRDYPLPVVAHDIARRQTLQRYAVVKKTSGAID